MLFFNYFKWKLYKNKLDSVQLVVLDVDGVLTNGKINYSSDGKQSKEFDVKDGLGIKMMQKTGIEVCLISGGEAGATKFRAEKLLIKNFMFDVKDKLSAIVILQKELNKSKKETLFLGDDINDQVVKPEVNLLVSTKDGVQSLRRKSDLVLNSKGGCGAVRELADKLLSSKNLLDTITSKGWKDKN